VDITDGRHRYLGLPEKMDWGPAHRARIKPTDIDMIVKSPKGRLLVVEYKQVSTDVAGDRVEIMYLQYLVLRELHAKGIECWVLAQSNDDESFWWLLDDPASPFEQPFVSRRKNRGRTVAWWKLDDRWQLLTEDELIARLEAWYGDE